MTPQTSILADFLEGRAMPEQWLGLAFVVAVGVVGFVALLRQHIRDAKEDARNQRGGRVRF